MTTTAVRERPILFSAPMVLAILAGKKTQTRRVVMHRKRKDGVKMDLELLRKIGVGGASPFGVPGDRLYVKEAAWMWCERKPNGKTKTGRQKWLYVPLRCAPIFYCADGHKPSTSITSPDTGNLWLWRWKAGRFLPPDAAQFPAYLKRAEMKEGQ